MSNPERCQRAGVPAEVKFKTKPQLAVELIDQALADGVALAPVLADSVYGDSWEFRQELRERSLEFFLQVHASEHKGWTQEVAVVKKKKLSYVDDKAPAARTLLEIAQQLSASQWRHCTWKTRSGSTCHTRMAWLEVWLARGLRKGQHELEKVWLVVDWPEGEPKPYHCYLALFHRKPSQARCLRLSRGRWQIEQYFQRSKDDLGLDHYEGRSWRGFHHHLVLSAAAYLFVVVMLARSKKNFWPDVGKSPQGDAAVAGEVVRVLSLLPP